MENVFVTFWNRRRMEVGVEEVNHNLIDVVGEEQESFPSETQEGRK